MSLKIYKIQNHGDAANEYVMLEATADVNIHAYMVADRTFTKSGELSNVHRHTFRFPSYDVKKGEFVVLYTRKGSPHVGETTNGSPSHRFYWGSEAAFWNDTNIEQAELLKVETVDKVTLNSPPKRLVLKRKS